MLTVIDVLTHVASIAITVLAALVGAILWVLMTITEPKGEMEDWEK